MAIYTLAGLALLPNFYYYFCELFPLFNFHLIDVAINSIFLFQFWGWFALGICIYFYKNNSDKKYILISISLLPLILTDIKNISYKEIISNSIILLIFILCIFNPSTQKIINNKLLIFMGYISYPLFLIHENIVIGLTVKMRILFPNLHPMMTPLPGLVLILTIAYLIAKYAEPWLMGWLKKLIKL